MWKKRFNVVGSQGDPYTVAVTDTGTWGCSCPAWKFHKAPKPDCKHINVVKGGLSARRAKPVQPKATRFEPLAQPALAVVMLDMEMVEVAATLPSSTRFAHLDYEVTVQ